MEMFKSDHATTSWRTTAPSSSSSPSVIPALTWFLGNRFVQWQARYALRVWWHNPDMKYTHNEEGWSWGEQLNFLLYAVKSKLKSRSEMDTFRVVSRMERNKLYWKGGLTGTVEMTFCLLNILAAEKKPENTLCFGFAEEFLEMSAVGEPREEVLVLSQKATHTHTYTHSHTHTGAARQACPSMWVQSP